MSTGHSDYILRAAHRLLVLHELAKLVDLNAYPRQQLADALGVHRITLWRHLQDLKRLDVDVQAALEKLQKELIA